MPRVSRKAVNSQLNRHSISGLKKIAYLVSHGFAARMLMQTDLAGRLAEKGHSVYIICPDVKDPVLENYCRKWNIELIGFRSSKFIWKSNYSLYRTYFLENIKSNPALYEKHFYEMYRMKSRFRFLKWIPGWLIYVNALFRNISLLRTFYQRIEKQLLNDKAAQQLLKTKTPDLLISTYPANIHEGVLLHNARTLQIKTAIHLLSWDNITSKGRFYTTADHYIVWGNVMADELADYYSVPKSELHVCGIPHFDLHHHIKSDPDRMRLIRDTGINPAKPYLLFGMSSPRFVPCEIEVVEELARKIEDNYFGADLQMLVRPHPQNVSGGMADLSWLPRLQKIKSKRVRIFYPLLAESQIPWSMEREDMKKLAAALSECLVCINSCSTLSIDALMAGKSSIAPMFDGRQTLPYWSSAKRLLKYIHIDKLVRLKGIEVAEDESSLCKLITLYQQDAVARYQLAQNAKLQECTDGQGIATDKVIACVEQIVQS